MRARKPSSAGLGRHLEQLTQAKLDRARRISLEDMDTRPLQIKLRDGVARLFAPYL